LAKEVFIHVGLHKTGTSFLQERVFPSLPEVRFVHPTHRLSEGAGPIEAFFFDMFFRNAACIDIEGHAKRIHSWMEALDEDKVLISSEAVVGWPVENHFNLRNNVELLATLFPRARILFVVRRQDDWAESAYRQVLRSGFSTSIERYLNFRAGEFGRYNIGLYNGPNLDARDLDWAAFHRLLATRFEGGCLTLPYEQLRADRADFFAQLLEWLDVQGWSLPPGEDRVNEAWSPASLMLARLVNRVPMPVKQAIRSRVSADLHPAELFNRLGLGSGRASGRGQHLSADLRLRLMRLHEASNRGLCELLGGALAEHGYY
jgi:hypothetical protein